MTEAGVPHGGDASRIAAQGKFIGLWSAPVVVCAPRAEPSHLSRLALSGKSVRVGPVVIGLAGSR